MNPTPDPETFVLAAFHSAPVLGGIPQISIETLIALQDANAPFLLLDVREPYEFEEANIPGAILIPLGDLARVGTPAFQHDLDPNTNTPTIIMCRSGQRSQQAAYHLQSLGFKIVANLEGGILAFIKKSLNV